MPAGGDSADATLWCYLRTCASQNSLSLFYSPFQTERMLSTVSLLTTDVYLEYLLLVCNAATICRNQIDVHSHAPRFTFNTQNTLVPAQQKKRLNKQCAISPHYTEPSRTFVYPGRRSFWTCHRERILQLPCLTNTRSFPIHGI